MQMVQQQYLQVNNMAITKASLKSKIESELTSAGFVLPGEHAKASGMAQAIANAVIDEITENGLVVVAGGSSAGTYQIT